MAFKADILAATELTASVGVSHCKFLAKLASAMNKPDGLTVIRSKGAQRLLPTLPLGAFFGVGPKTVQRLAELGLRTGADVQRQPLELLKGRLGKQGRYLFELVRSVDERPVNPHRVRKSIGVARTFKRDVTSRAALLAELPPSPRRGPTGWPGRGWERATSSSRCGWRHLRC